MQGPKCVEKTLSHLRSKSERHVYNALVFVRTNLSKRKKEMEQLLQKGFISIVFELLTKSKSEAEKSHADLIFSILGNLCLSENVRRQVHENKGVEIIAKYFVECESESIQNRSCRTLANLCLDAHCCLTVCKDKDLIQKVVKLLNDSKNKECILTYCRAIRLFGQVSETKWKLSEVQAFHAVAKLIKHDDSEVKKNAIRALYELSSTSFGDEFTRQINSANICSELLELTKVDDDTTSQHAHKTFLKLSTHSNLRPQLGAAGAVNDLLSLYKKEKEMSKKCHFLSTLCLYCVEAVNRVRIRENGILFTFLESLQNVEFKLVHDKVISAFVYFLYDESSFKILLENRLIPILLLHFQKCGKFDIIDVTEACDEMNSACDKWVSLQSNKALTVESLPLQLEVRQHENSLTMQFVDHATFTEVESDEQALDHFDDGAVDAVASDFGQDEEMSDVESVSEEMTVDVHARIDRQCMRVSSNTSQLDTDNENAPSLSESRYDVLDPEHQQLSADRNMKDSPQDTVIDSTERPFYSIDSPSYREISGRNIDEKWCGTTCKQKFSPSSSHVRTSPYSPLSPQSYYSPMDNSPDKKDTSWSYEWKTPELSPLRSRSNSSSPSGFSDGPAVSVDGSESPQGKFDFDLYPPVGSLHYLTKSPVTVQAEPVEDPVYSSSEEDESQSLNDGKVSSENSDNEGLISKNSAKRNLSATFLVSPQETQSKTQKTLSEKRMTSASDVSLTTLNISKSDGPCDNLGLASSSDNSVYNDFSIESIKNPSTESVLTFSASVSHTHKLPNSSTTDEKALTDPTQPKLMSYEAKLGIPVCSNTILTCSNSSADVQVSENKALGSSETCSGSPSVRQKLHQKLFPKFTEPLEVKKKSSYHKTGLKVFRQRSRSPGDESDRPSKYRKIEKYVAISRVTEDNILKIFSRLSNQEDPSKFIRETSLFISLVVYAVKSNKPFSRCGRILQRLVKNNNCFEHLIKISAPWIIHTYLCHTQATEMEDSDDVVIPSPEMNTSPKSGINSQSDLFSSPYERRWSTELFKSGVENIVNSVELGKTLLRNLSFIAESYYGDGVISKVLHRSSDGEKLRLQLNYPFLARTKDVIQKMIVTPRLHEKFLDILQSDDAPDKLKEVILGGLSYMPDKMKVEYVLLSENLNLIFPQTIKVDAPHINNCYYDGSKESHNVVFSLDSEKKCSAGRDILVKNSSVFAAMLEGHYCESNQSEVAIIDASHGPFLYILHFLHGCKQHCDIIGGYSNEVTAKDVEEVLEILTLADRYLISILHTYLLCLISTLYLKWENIPLVFSYAFLHDYSTLADECIKRMLMSTDGTLQDRLAVFSELLRSSYKENVMEILNRLLFS